MSLQNVLLLIGIGFELWGFIWLLIYDHQATRQEYEKWGSKYANKEKKTTKIKYVFEGESVDAATYVFSDFLKMRKAKRKLAIILVIIGLILEFNTTLITSFVRNDGGFTVSSLSDVWKFFTSLDV